MKNAPSTTHALRQTLARADARWRGEQSRAMLWRTLPWLSSGLLAACALDAFFQLSIAPRLTLLAMAFIALAIVAGLAAHRAWIRRNPAERVARHLEARSAALGSKLINALQLANQADDATVPALTRRLAADAVGRYDGELVAADLPRIASTGSDRRALERGLLWVAGAAVLGLAFYPVMEVVLPRFADPFGDHPPYSFTRVEIAKPLEEGAPVVYGGKLAVRATWSGHEPKELFLSAYSPDKPDAIATIPMVRDGADGYIAEVADVRTDLVLTAHAKDRAFYSRQRLARVVLTPLIEQGWAEIAPPAYTSLRTEERKLDFKTLGALEGSILRFRIRSNRPLRSGQLEVRREGAVDDKPDLIPLAARGEHEVGGELPATTDARLRFKVTDVDGLVSEATPETLLSLSHDLAPLVEVREPGQDGFASIGLPLDAKFAATDDYGVRRMRIHRALNGVYTSPMTVEIEGVRRDAAQNLKFDFAGLGALPGDRVSVFAEAIDTAPTAHMARSRTVTVTLISEDEYNRHLRELSDVESVSKKYESLVERFEQLRAEQAKLAEEAKALAEKIAKDGATAEDEARLDALAARQDAVDSELERLAKNLGEAVNPNPIYDFERDLAKRLSNEAGALRDSVQQSRDDGEAARKNGGDAKTRTAALERRAREQAERLGARKEQIKESVEQPLRDLAKLHELIKDFSLFEQAHLEQQALAEQMRAYESTPKPSREDQLAMKDIAARQAAVRELLRQLPERLREHAKDAESQFPKACKTGRDMADAIEQGRLGSLAENATQRLLQADGKDGAALTQRLANEMAALMSQCQGGEGEASDELDQYLSAKLPGAGGGAQSWEQMRQSRRFGLGEGMQGLASRPGSAGGQTSGYSTAGNNAPPVLGAEVAAASQSAGQAAPRTGKGSGQGEGPGDGGTPAVQTNKPDVMHGLNPSDRQSGATPTEQGAEEYRELIDEYFRRITRP